MRYKTQWKLEIFTELNHRFMCLEEKEQKDKLNEGQAQEIEYSQDTDSEVQVKPESLPRREEPKWEDTLTNRVLHRNYTEGQKEKLQKAVVAKIPIIMEYFYPDVSVEEMRDRFYNVCNLYYSAYC